MFDVASDQQVSKLMRDWHFLFHDQAVIHGEVSNQFVRINLVNSTDPDVASFLLTGLEIFIENEYRENNFRLRNICGTACKGWYRVHRFVVAELKRKSRLL